jgi:hypothetical protein
MTPSTPQPRPRKQHGHDHWRACYGETRRAGSGGDHAEKDPPTGKHLAAWSTPITRFAPLLDHVGDLRDTVVTVDALHCQRDHVAYIAERGADWILTVKANIT